MCDCGKEGESITTSFTKATPKDRCNDCQRRKPRKTLEDTALRSVYNQYKHSAQVRDLEFELSEQEVRALVTQNCSYCSQEPTVTNERYPYPYNGIDRQDSSIGYSMKNVVPCCKTCNMMKKDLTTKDWLNHMKKIINFYGDNK